MKKRILLLSLLLGLGLAAGAKDLGGIPEARFRVLYQVTKEPVNWIAVQIYCQRKLSWRERWRIGWQEDYETVYDSFSFHPTEDGWVTLPAIHAPGTTEYEIEIYAPGCAYFLYPYKYSGDSASRPFNEETLPKFLNMPEEKRVLYAEYAPECKHFIPSVQGTYEGIAYSLEAFRIFLLEWPTQMCNGIGETPPYGTWSEGGRAPYYKELYFERVLSSIHFRNLDLSCYERGVDDWTCRQKNERLLPLSPEELAERHAKAQELRARLREIVCKDLQEKKRIWDAHELHPAQIRTGWPPSLQEWRKQLKAREGQKEFDPPSKFLDDPFIQGADCEALREFYARRKAGEKEPSSAVAPAEPAAATPPPPAPAQPAKPDGRK